ncbi:MAG: DHHA1 domain-containing protein [Candidatus Aenigmatarchaeota archaeon]
MSKKLEEQYKIAKRFLDNIKGSISIVFHGDGDGVTSAVQVSKYLESLGKEVILVEPNDKSGIYLSNELVERIKDAENIVFVDLAIDQTEVPEKIHDKDVLVIDHHTIAKDLNEKENFTHINPRFFNEKLYLPASYLCYRTLNKEEFLWIAGMGVVSDYGVRNCQDLMKELEDRYPELVKEGLTQEKTQESKIGLYSNLINSAKGVKGNRGLKEAYNILYDCEEHEDIMSGRLIEYHEKFEGELKKLLDDFEKNATHYSKSNSYLYKIDSKYRISSTLSTVMSGKNPGSLIFIIRENGDLQINVRCQTDRVDVGKLTKELVKGIGKGGGHPNAAGGKIPAKNKERFMNRLKENLDLHSFEKD